MNRLEGSECSAGLDGSEHSVKAVRDWMALSDKNVVRDWSTLSTKNTVMDWSTQS